MAFNEDSSGSGQDEPWIQWWVFVAAAVKWGRESCVDPFVTVRPAQKLTPNHLSFPFFVHPHMHTIR
jgi:hypothetical protein